MKKIFIVLTLMLCLALLLVGCDGEKTKATAAETKVANDKTTVAADAAENTKEIQQLKSASDLCAEEPTRCNDDSGLLALTLEANPDL